MSLLALRTVKELESMTVRQKCALWVFPTKKKRKGEPSPGQKICVMLPGNVPESKRAPPPRTSNLTRSCQRTEDITMGFQLAKDEQFEHLTTATAAITRCL